MLMCKDLFWVRGRNALSGSSVYLWLHVSKHSQVCILPLLPTSASRDGVAMEKQPGSAAINE